LPVQSEKAFEFHYDGRFRNPRAIAALARVRQQLYAEDKFTEILAQMEAFLPKDEAGNFIAEQERSDVVHDSPGLPGGKNAEDGFRFMQRRLACPAAV